MQKQVKVECKAYLVGRHVTSNLDGKRYEVVGVNKKKNLAELKFAGGGAGAKEVNVNHPTY